MAKACIGIDLGSTTVKAVALKGRVLASAIKSTGANPKKTGEAILENIARALEVSLEEFSQKSLASRSPANINSMCTVFAESEVISQIAQGTSIEDVSAGVYISVARRIKTMVEKIGVEDQVIFTGGTARSIAMKKALEETIKIKLIVPKEPQLVGALGAAVIGRDGY